MLEAITPIFVCNAVTFAGDELHQLCLSLQKSQNIQSITITSSNLTDDDAATIAEVFRDSSSLVEIDLTDNAIGSVGARAIASIASLQKVTLNLNLFIQDRGIAAFANHPNLTSLSIRFTGVTVNGVYALSKNKKLQYLNIGTNAMPVKVVDALRRFANLHSVDLSQTRYLNDDFSGELCRLKNITDLGMMVSPISDVGAERLLRNFYLVGHFKTSPHSGENPYFDMAIYNPKFEEMPVRNQILWQTHLMDSAMALAQGAQQKESQIFKLPPHIIVNILFYAIVVPHRLVFARMANDQFIENCLGLIVENVLRRNGQKSHDIETVKNWWWPRRFVDSKLLIFKPRDTVAQSHHKTAMTHLNEFQEFLSQSASRQSDPGI